MHVVGQNSVPARSTSSEADRADYGRLAAAIVDFVSDVRNCAIAVTPVDADGALADELKNVGAALADQGAAEVLLVDANLNEKSLSRVFDAEAKAGLVEILNLRKSSRELAVATGRSGLSLLPAGRGVLSKQTPPERAIAELVNQWKARYGYVLVDTGAERPPAARCIMRHCDACLIRLRYGGTRLRRAAAAVKNLRSEGVRLLGCIAARAA